MKQPLRILFFLSLAYCLGYLLYVYPISVLRFWLYGQHTSLGVSLAWTTLIFGLVGYYMRSKTTFFPLRLLVYTGMGLGFFSVLIIQLLNLLSQIISISNPHRIATFLIVLTLLSLIAYGSSFILKVRTVHIRSPKLTKSHRIVFISDVHLGSTNTAHLSTIIQKVQALNPDALYIGGDLIDSSAVKVDQLALFKTLKMPIFMVTGNHEYYIQDSKSKLAQLSDYNLQLLNNESHVQDDLCLIGLSDNQSTRAQQEQLQSLVSTQHFNIALVHKPSLWPTVPEQTDLTLCGHTHNGQLFPFNLLVRLQFPYAYGTYQNDQKWLYVSSGAGTWGPRMRLGTFNEVVLLTLHPSSK